MTFAEKLNNYMTAYCCTPKKLVKLSGVSAATVSRYRAGTREPSADSKIFENIVSGLCRAANEAKIADVSASLIKEDLLSVLSDESYIYDIKSLRINLDMLIGKLHLNSKDIADYIGMDQSRFFRIRTAQSRPPEIYSFCSGIGKYIYKMLGDDAALDTLSDILGCNSSELMSEDAVCTRITSLLISDAYSPRSYAESFLRELDKFDTADYFTRIDDTPYSFDNDAEREFISRIENCNTNNSAIICTDLYSGGSEDGKLLRSLEYIIALLVRKGIHIDLVLNADNPMDEILPGLKALMPVFMSGNISAYYLKGRRDGIYRYRLISLDNAAMTCEAVTGHYDCAITRVASTTEDAKSYRQRAEQILNLASPLIEVIDSNETRKSILISGAKKQGKRICVLSTPPFYTMSDALLNRILARNGVTKDEAKQIKKYFHAERARIKSILSHSEFTVSYPEISRESYDEKPVFLSLSGLFYNREILCTYGEYSEHVRLMKEFEEKHDSFRCIAVKNSPFRNVQIFMHSGQWIMLSKNKTPTIHLFINHSKLCQAFENILSPSGENV